MATTFAPVVVVVRRGDGHTVLAVPCEDMAQAHELFDHITLAQAGGAMPADLHLELALNLTRSEAWSELTNLKEHTS